MIRNTKYFHHHSNLRKRKNHIERLLNAAGVQETDQLKIEETAVGYFKDHFSTNASQVQHDEILADISIASFKTDHKEELWHPFVEYEVMEALKSMHSSKAPGLDGFHASFFQW